MSRLPRKPLPILDAAPVPPPWGEAHIVESHARMHELTAVAWRQGRALSCAHPMGTEDAFRSWLRVVAGLEPRRIRREVRRLRDLAEGRAVKESSERWRVRARGGRAWTFADRGEAENCGCENDTTADPCRLVRVRVTRIRRAPR